MVNKMDQLTQSPEMTRWGNMSREEQIADQARREIMLLNSLPISSSNPQPQRPSSSYQGSTWDQRSMPFASPWNAGQPQQPQSLPQPQQQPRGAQPNTPDLYAGPDYSKEQMGMGGTVPKGYYSGPLDGVHKYGEGPLASQTQEFLDNNPDYFNSGTQSRGVNSGSNTGGTMVGQGSQTQDLQDSQISNPTGGSSTGNAKWGNMSREEQAAAQPTLVSDSFRNPTGEASSTGNAKWDKIFNVVDTIGAVGGGLASAFGASGDVTTDAQTQVNNPWAPASPYMLDALQQSQDLYRSGQGSEYYPGQNFQQMGYDTSTGLNQMRDRAMAGSQTQNMANQNVQQMMQGGVNPHLNAMYNQGAEQITDNMKSLYSKAGRYGSNSMGEQTGKALGDYATNLYGNAYSGDQNNRLNAINMAGGIAQNDYADSQRLLGIGQGVEGYQTAERVADKAKWDFNNQNPYDRLGQYANMASSMGGMGGTKTGEVNRSTDQGLTSTFGDIGSIGGAISDIWGTNTKSIVDPKPGLNQVNWG